jgi:hypothetical protein
MSPVSGCGRSAKITVETASETRWSIADCIVTRVPLRSRDYLRLV